VPQLGELDASKGDFVKGNANWIVAAIVGAAIGFVAANAMNKGGTSTGAGPNAPMAPIALGGGDKGKTPKDLPPTFYKETDLPAGTLAGLTDQQKYSVLKAINEKNCTCGCANDTIAKCRKDDPSCGTAPKLVDQAVALAKQGQSAAQIEAALGGAAPGAPAAAPTAAANDNGYTKVPIGDSPTQGPADAKVTLVEITDFQCPFCGRAAPTVKALQDKYGKDLRLVVKMNPLPFHQYAAGAAEAAMAANAQGKFFPMYDLLFTNQAGDGLTPPKMEEYAKKIGLDMDKYKKDVAANTYAAKIKADQDLAQSIGMGGTPAFVINGKKLSGAQPQAQFEAIIDAEKKHAEELIARGVKPKDVYDEIMKSATATAAAPRAPNQPQAPPAAQVRKVDVGDSYARGAKDAKVTIVMFSDFQCPFCGRVEPTLKQILDTYPKDVRIVWRNQPLPFHPNAMPAAEAAMAAGAQGKFWEMHDKMFADQSALSPDNYTKWGGEIGLNMGKFKADNDSHKYKSKIDEDSHYGQSVGANGTPTFFINGRQLVGAQPFDSFKTVIDQEIVRADLLIKKGIKGPKLYEALVEENLKSQPPSNPTQVNPTPPGGAQAPAPNERKTVDIGSSPVLGPANAPVSVVIFSDFQCPFCGRVEPTLKQLQTDYAGKVKFIWKNQPLPFHPNAMPAAKAAMAAGAQGKFWQMHDLMFQNQQQLGDQSYEKWAKDLGLNMDKWKADMASPKIAAAIEADSKQGTALGANGTPSFFINGRSLVGAQPIEQFKAVIDDELKNSPKGTAAKPGSAKKGV
jgi:protein-disulfide isomerase